MDTLLMLVSPIVALIQNTATSQWHPVLFVEYPLPGEDSADKPVRHRSKAHRTDGFATREEAEANCKSELAAGIPHLRFELGTVFYWDGKGVPAIVHFFGPAEHLPVDEAARGL